MFTLPPGFVADAAETVPSPSDRNQIAIEALSRLKGIDFESNPVLKAAVLKVLESAKGKPQFVEIVRDFKITNQSPALIELAAQNPTNSTGVEAIKLVLEQQNEELLKKALAERKPDEQLKLVEVLGNTARKQVVPLLAALLAEPKRDLAVRKQAIRSLAQIEEGATLLLEMAKSGTLSEELKITAGAELNRVRWEHLKLEAARLLPLPQAANAQPLPPMSELLRQSGDSARGAKVFARPDVACANCHQIHGAGIDFGPNLSEIGTKLGKDALYEAILNPSAGISFGYEAWQIELGNGDEAFGLIISETADELAVKAQTGIVTRYKKNDIAQRKQQTLSIMPEGLQQMISLQELVDLVEYLASLKKRP